MLFNHRPLSRALSAFAVLAAPAAFAGDVVIQKIDLQSGALSPWAQGALEHAPARLLERSDPWLLDSCGQVFGFKEGTFGDMSLDGPLTPLYSLRDVKHFDVNDYSGVAITGEGKLVKLILDRATRTRMGESGFDWIEDPGSTIPAGDTSILVHTRAGSGTYLFKKNGDLMKIEAFGEGRDKGRYLGARGSWKDVTHAIVAELLMGPNEVQQVLVTAHRDGSIKRHIISGSNGGDYMLESATLDGKFADTAALMPGSGFNQSHVLRLTNGGNLYRVDVSKGVEERLGAEGAFAGGIVHVGESFGYYVSSSGDFSTSCPEKPVVQEVVDPYADFDVVAVVDEFDAMNKVEDEFSMAIDERVDITPPDGLLGKSEAEIDSIMNAFMANLAAFENERLNPVIRQAEAFKAKYTVYGDFNELFSLVREKSDNKYRIDNPIPGIEGDVAEYKDYKASLGEYILGEARIQFQVAELQSDAKLMAKEYLAAVPIAKWTLKLDPENEEAQGYVDKAAGLAGAAIGAEKAAIAKAVWPEDTEHCECDLDEFKERGLHYFARTVEKEQYADGTRVVAIRIRSSMKPGETNVLGEILNWHVRGWIALTDPQEPWFLTIRPVEFDTETNDRNSRFGGYHVDGDEYQIPIDRVEIDDEAALEESLEIIEETTGLTPDDMPEDALDPSVTGIPGADGGSAGGDPGNGGGAGGGSSPSGSGGGSNASTPDAGDPGAGASNEVAESASVASGAEAAGGAAGRVFGWLIVLGLLGGAAWAAHRWRGRIREELARRMSPEQRAALAGKMRGAQQALKEKSAQAAEKAREAGAAAAQKAREAGESATAKAREAGEQALRKVEEHRKQ